MTEKSVTPYETWRSRPIFISSTFRDMHAERDWLFQRVFPRLEEELRKRRHHLEPIDLRLGVETVQTETEEANELLVLKVCLDEVKRSRPFLLVLLGDRYGWMPARERMDAAAQEQGFQSDLTGRSVTSLEIEFGLLKENPTQKRRSLFFFRSPLPYAEMSQEVAANYSDEFSQNMQIVEGHRRLVELKKYLRNDSEVGSQVFDYSVEWDKSTNKITGLEAFGELVFQKLWAVLDEETNAFASHASLTWEEQERVSLEEFIEHRNRGFVGRKELLTQLLAIACRDTVKSTEQVEHPIFGACILGSSGSGKSALFAKLYSQLNANKTVFLLANTSGGTIRGSSVDAMLRRWIDELSKFLDIPNPVVDVKSSDTVDLLFHSLLNRASTQRRVVLLLDALDQAEPTPRSQYLTWLKASSWCSNASILVTTMPCKSATAFCEMPGVLQIQLPPLTPIDTDAIVRSVWQRYHREVNSAVLKELTQKSLASGLLAAGNPLWLTLASEQLNLLDADDFSRAEQDFRGTPVERMQALVLDTARRMPSDVSTLYHWLFDQAVKSFGMAPLKGFLAAMALSRHGWRESDLQVLIPQLIAMFENETISSLPNIVHKAAMKHYISPYASQNQFLTSQEIFPVAELAAMRRAFRAGLMLRNELQWDFFHREARLAALAYLKLDSEDEKALHAVIAAFLIEQGNDDPVRCDELSFHLLQAEEFSWLQIYYGSSNSTLPRELVSTTTTFVEEINRAGMQQFINISNIDVAPSIVGGEDGVDQEDIDKIESFKKSIRRDIAKGWCQRCIEYLLPSIASICSVSDQRDLVKMMLSRLSDSTEDFPNDLELQQIISVLQHIFSELSIKQGDWSHAKRSQTEALQGFEGLVVGIIPDEKQISELCNSLMLQGDLNVQEGLLYEAKQTYIRARDLFLGQQACNNAGFAIVCDKLGDLSRSQGEYAAAHNFYAQALSIFRKLASVNSTHQRDLSLCLSKLGELATTEKVFEQAKIYLKEHLEFAADIARVNPENAEYQRDLAGAYGRMMHLANAQNDILSAVQYAEIAHNILEKIAWLDVSNAALKQDLAGSYYSLGNVVEDSGNKKRAVTLYTKSAQVLHELHREGRLNAQGRRLMLGVAVFFGKLTDQKLAVDIICGELDLISKSGNDIASVGACVVDLTLVSRLPHREQKDAINRVFRKYEASDDIVRAGVFVVEVKSFASKLLNRKQHDGAERVLRKLLPVMSAAHGENSREVLSMINDLGMIMKRKGNVLEAEGLFRKAYEGMCLLAGHEDPLTQKIHSNLVNVLYQLSLVGSDTVSKSNASNVAQILLRPLKWSLNQLHSVGRRVAKESVSNGNRLEIKAHKANIMAIIINRVGDCFITGGADGLIKIWNIDQRKPLHTISAHKKSVTGLAITQDFSRVFSCSWDRTVKAWNINDGSLSAKSNYTSADLSSIVSTADGKNVYLVGEDGVINEWSPNNFGLLRIVGYHLGAAMIALSDDGNSLVSGSSDGVMAILKPKTTSLFGILQGHAQGIWSVAIARNGLVAVSGSKDKIVILWDLETLKMLRTFTGHGEVVSTLVLSDDAHFLASGSWDKTVRIWRLSDGKQLALFNFASPVWSVAVSGDFSVLLVGEKSGLVTILKLDQQLFALPT